jgi:hypothetical protein
MSFIQQWKPEVKHAWTNLKSEFLARRHERVSGSEWFVNAAAGLQSAVSTLTM